MAAHASRVSYLTATSRDSHYSAETGESSAATGGTTASGSGSRSTLASKSPSPLHSPHSSRTASPSLQSHGTYGTHQTPPSPQDTFGPYTPMTPGFSQQMPTMPVVPEPAHLQSTVDLTSSPEPQSPLPSPPRLKRPESPDSLVSHESGKSYGQATTRSGRSNRSSWQFQASPGGSTAALAIARKQRVSQAPPLPDKPYMPPPETQQRPLTPNAATSLLAAATATASAGIQTPTPSASLLPSPRSARFGTARERAAARLADMNKPLPEIRSDTPKTSTELPKTSTDLASAIAAGEVPRFAFLDEDPTRADSPASMRGGVMAYSGPSAPPHAARRVSAPQGDIHRLSPAGSGSTQRKHMSVQSATSEPFAYGQFQSPYNGSSMADAGASERSSPGSGSGSSGSRPGPMPLSPFAGGPPIAWGRRDSQRSIKSAKSARSSRSKKRRSKPGAQQQEWEDDEEVDLFSLARRAAVLERLLRSGKRVSNLPASQRSYQRYSAWSVSTHNQSNPPSRHASSRFGRVPTPSRSRATTPTPSAPSSSHSHSARRSGQSSTSIRRRLQRTFGMKSERQFTGLDSGDDEDQTVESMGSAPPRTPIRRAFSSFSKDATPPPGAGVGVIVFPELATLQPIDPPFRDGEVCAQACLPPSIAVPYTPLQPPPPVLVHKKSYSASGSSGLMSKASGMLKEKKSIRSVHEKYGERTTVLMGDVPMCDEAFGRVRSRRAKLIAVFLCVAGIVLIVGLLAGLLSRR